MKSFCLILAFLVFTLACRSSGPLVRIEQGRTQGEKPAQRVAQKTPGASEAAATRQEAATAGKTLAAEPKLVGEVIEQQEAPKPGAVSAVEPKPAQGAAGKQEDTKPKKTPPPEVLKQLIALIEREKAAKEQVAAAEEEIMLEISGLIIEQTMTKIGYDFYEYFFLLWEAPEGISVRDYNIFINERASPMWGSWVRVGVDETTVWSRVLRPRSEEIEDAAKEAIAVTRQYLSNYEQYQFKTNDMAGTGI